MLPKCCWNFTWDVIQMLAVMTVMLKGYWTAEVLSFDWVLNLKRSPFLELRRMCCKSVNFEPSALFLYLTIAILLSLRWLCWALKAETALAKSILFQWTFFDFICEPFSRGLVRACCYLRPSHLTLSFVNLFDSILTLSCLWLDMYYKLIQCDKYWEWIIEIC